MAMAGKKRGWAIEITQPQITSKALLEILATRDQETHGA
jgi:hypothetical protein